MMRTIPAVFDSGVFRPLTPVDLAQGTPVEVQLQLPEAASSDQVSAEMRQAWHAYLDRMESLPDNTPTDGLSNRDHDRILYGK